ncbi:MAG: hypothetical protein H6839_01545 [Planctomycetes bacterium]|nr:hypothetical protein [Planctomycetota bacterium]
MSTRWKIIIAAITLSLLGTGLVVSFLVVNHIDTYETEHTDVQRPKPRDLLADDKLEDKKPEFDPELIDSRPFGEGQSVWQINASAAVIELDVPDIRSDESEALQRLYPDYASAAKALKAAGLTVLPSVNLLGGKAKQFDDGLYAALDQYMVQNSEVGVRDMELCVRQILTELNPAGEPYAWLWASLEVGRFITPEEHQRRPAMAGAFVESFLLDEARSRPVGFYTWNENLKRVFQFLRYLQQPFFDRAGTPQVLANALARNGQAREQYVRMLEFYAKLSDPFKGMSLLPLLVDGYEGKSLEEIARSEHAREPSVAFLPYSDSPEVQLFDRLYPEGLPPGAELMADLITAIRDGKLDLKPGANSGWYDYQLYALETLILPERGEGNDKLMLTKKYKLRLLDAFKAMVTKTRETHIRGTAAAGNAAGAAYEPEAPLTPRLRVEPNPSYYLRMARSYAFLQNFLNATVEDLNGMPGWCADGRRDSALGDELENMRLLFYGLYFVSCEDIGHKPQTLDGEIDEPAYVRTLASKWLEDWESDPDLGVDTRVAVPIFQSDTATRFWCTVGVRPIKLRAAYRRPPSWRAMPSPGDPPGDWVEVDSYQTEPLNCVILGDDFLEVELGAGATLTRTELRSACDAASTREEIAAALQH